MKQFLIIWLAVMITDNLLPFILAQYYNGYDHKKMVLSVLGCKQSPVKWYYNIWCIISGIVFVIAAFKIHSFFSGRLSLVVCILVVIYGFGCEIISGLFPLNENRENQDTCSKIHGIGSALGFTSLLFCPLLLGIAAFMADLCVLGTVCILSFVAAFTFFTFFILGEKEKFFQTALQYGGLWQRLTLAFTYIPFIWLVISTLQHSL